MFCVEQWTFMKAPPSRLLLIAYIYDYIMCELLVVGISSVYRKTGYVPCHMIPSYLPTYLPFFSRSTVWIFKLEPALSKQIKRLSINIYQSGNMY